MRHKKQLILEQDESKGPRELLLVQFNVTQICGYVGKWPYFVQSSILKYLEKGRCHDVCNLIFFSKAK